MNRIWVLTRDMPMPKIWARACPVSEFQTVFSLRLIFNLSNARSEAVNNKIKLIIRTAFGFRNVDNMVAMVMLSCSELHPTLPGR